MKPLYFPTVVALVFVVQLSCWAQKVTPGVYVNEKDKENYIELALDGTFYSAGPTIGRYHAKNDSLMLVTEGPSIDTVRFKIAGKSLITKVRRWDYESRRDYVGEEKWTLWTGGKTRKEYRENNSLWFTIPPGHSEDLFALRIDGVVLFDGKRLAEFRFFDPGAAELLVSPPSPQKKYQFCFLLDRDKGAKGGILIDIKNKTKLLDVNASMRWVSWSPQEKYVLVGSYYEADISLSRIDIQNLETEGIPIKLAKEGEEQSFDLDNLRWISPQMFTLRVTINCNPYTDPNCTDKDRKKVLRSYEVQVNAATLAVTYKETPTEVSPSIKQPSGGNDELRRELSRLQADYDKKVAEYERKKDLMNDRAKAAAEKEIEDLKKRIDELKKQVK
jgi:hypothetical protein